MDGNSAPKRQLEDDDALEPDAKRPKPSDNEIDDDEHPHAYTRLPPEILLDIFDYLKPEDDCMKKLSQVCKKFKNLCSPRLRVFRLDFDKIAITNSYPIIRRGYTEIRMFGNEIDCNRAEIHKVLETSRKTARSLIINNSGSRKLCKIKMRILLFILRSLPNLVDVKLTMIEGLLPQISSKAIQSNEQPKLSQLKKLTLISSFLVCSAFSNAEGIEELQVYLSGLRNKREQKCFTAFVYKQKNLRLLHSVVFMPAAMVSDVPFLDATVGGNDIENLFKKFPKLEHLELSPKHPFRMTQPLLTAGPPVASLKTIKLSYIQGSLDIDQIRKKFPSLESFKSYYLNWESDQTT